MQKHGTCPSSLFHHPGLTGYCVYFSVMFCLLMARKINSWRSYTLVYIHEAERLRLRYIFSISHMLICRLHWRIRGDRWPPVWKDCYPTQRSTEQMLCHLPSFQYSSSRAWKLGQSALACKEHWLYCPYHQCWNHGSWGGKTETCCRQDSWIFLLGMSGM